MTKNTITTIYKTWQGSLISIEATLIKPDIYMRCEGDAEPINYDSLILSNFQALKIINEHALLLSQTDIQEIILNTTQPFFTPSPIRLTDEG